MSRYAFEWDAEKANANETKHDVSFEEAKTVFADLFAVEKFDVIHSTDEDRFIIIGTSEDGRLLTVAFTLRGLIIRLISAREAMRGERLNYEKQITDR